MSLKVNKITYDSVSLSVGVVVMQEDLNQIRSAALRIFQPVALITDAELSNIIATAQHTPEHSIKMLQKLHAEFFS